MSFGECTESSYRRKKCLLTEKIWGITACVQLFVNDVCPTPSALSTINALSMMVNSALRASAPAIFTSLFALSVKLRWAEGHLCWLVLAVLTLPLGVVLYHLPKSLEKGPCVNK